DRLASVARRCNLELNRLTGLDVEPYGMCGVITVQVEGMTGNESGRQEKSERAVELHAVKRARCGSGEQGGDGLNHETLTRRNRADAALAANLRPCRLRCTCRRRADGRGHRLP